MTTLSTQPVKGMRDILGKQARVKKKIEFIITQTAQKYGFDPMQVPVLENLAVLTVKGGGGEAAEKELFTLEDQSGRKLGMRFEFTTSLARVVAGNPDLPKPIKTLNMGTVYRYDNPQFMRYREFTQGDCDIIGSNKPAADAECLLLSMDVMKQLGFTDYYLRVNDRRIINSILALGNVPEDKAKEAMRTLDKLDKIGIEGVEKELQEKNISTQVMRFLNKDFDQIKKEIASNNGNMEGVLALEQVFTQLSVQQKMKYVKYDPSLIRGLDYYTGMVVEIFAGVNVAVGGGGRYDNLIKTLGGPDLPAVGISFGVDRLMDILVERWDDVAAEIYIIPIGNTLTQAQALASELREQGLKVEVDLMTRNIGKNMQYADTKKVPIVLFMGEDELQKKSVKIRDMKTGEEKMVPLAPISKIVDEIKGILAKK
ncbi:MAG: histidine--tRNA ligase [Candidatus Diapherotrites archaeon]|uniref:Histidine--tRNA ligase n=1 Tax=Candidatus Iainarchaeum sp. TaxID=3101447 RepID=A0A8T4CA00_9ARCH|nr:histidine--tRNA ligase [Candidatus Diapherotrites archaeon]